MMSHVAVSRGAVAVRRSWRGEAANGKLRRVKARRSIKQLEKEKRNGWFSKERTSKNY
jgi:hypothetical protein